MPSTGRRKSEQRKPGRPRGVETVAFPLRLKPDQKRDLEIIGSLLEGNPPVNGLIQTAVTQYIAAKLRDGSIRHQYEARLNPRLKMLG